MGHHVWSDLASMQREAHRGCLSFKCPSKKRSLSIRHLILGRNSLRKDKIHDIRRDITAKFPTILLCEEKGENTMTITIDGKVAGTFSVALLSVGLLGSLTYISM